MRILQVQTQAEAGGAQRVSSMLAKGLKSEGHQVVTAFLYRRTSAYDDEDAVAMLDSPPQSAADYCRAVWRLAAHARKYRPDVVISYQHYGNIAGSLAAKFSGCSKLIANQNGMPDGVGIPRAAMILDRYMGQFGIYDANVVNSVATRDAFSSYPSAYRHRLVLIEHGVAKLSSARSVEDARRQFGLPLETPIIGSMGRLSEQKNHQILVHALAWIPSAHLAIAGGGPLAKALLNKADELGVGNRFHLIGEIPPKSVGDFFQALDVFAFPSVWETFGLAVVEAAVFGKPVICSDLPILREVLTSPAGKAAAVFADSADIKLFAEKLFDVLNNAALQDSLVEAGVSVSEKYSLERMIKGYADLLR